MSRPERGNGEAWLRGGQTVGHTADMVMEVVGRLAIGWALLGACCFGLLCWRAPADEGAAGRIAVLSWALKSIGNPLPQMVSFGLPGQEAGRIPVGQVWNDPVIGPPAHAYIRMAGDCGMIWLIATLAMLMGTSWWFTRAGREKIKTRQLRGQTVTTVTDLVGQIEAYNKLAFAEKAQRLMAPAIMEGASPEEARSGLRASDLVAPKLAGVPYPCDTEMQHTMVCGGPGSGKTEAIHQLIASIRSKGQRAIIFDPELDFIRSHYDAARDTILNPFDARSPGWSPFNDAVDRPDWDRLGHAVFKDPRSGDPYWVGVARALFSWTGYQLRRRNPNVELPEALDMLFGPTKALQALLEGTPAAKHLEGSAGARVSSLESVLTAGVEPLIYLYGSTKTFSVRDWTNRPADVAPGGFLYLSAPESHMDAIRPLLGFWSEIAVSAILSRHDTEREPTWIILDEFHSAGRIDKLADGPQRLRKYGGAVVLGFQQVSQLQDLYGPDKSRTIMGQCATKLILRAGDFDTAEMMSEQIGRRVMRRVEENTSYGANSIRDGVGLAPKEELEPICLPENVMNFPSLQGIVRVSNARPSAPFPVAPIRIGLIPRDQPWEGFVPKDRDPVEDYLGRLRTRFAEVAASERAQKAANEAAVAIAGAEQLREVGRGAKAAAKTVADPAQNPKAAAQPKAPPVVRRPPNIDPAEAMLGAGGGGTRRTLGGAPDGAAIGRLFGAAAPEARTVDADEEGSFEATRAGPALADAAEGDESDDTDRERSMEPRQRDLPTEEGVMHRRREDESEALRLERAMAERRNDLAPVRVSVIDKEGAFLTRSLPTDQMDTMSVATDQDIVVEGLHHSGFGEALDILASAVVGNAISLAGDETPADRSAMDGALPEEPSHTPTADEVGHDDEIRFSPTARDEMDGRPNAIDTETNVSQPDALSRSEARSDDEFVRAAGEMASKKILSRGHEPRSEPSRDDYGLERNMDR